MLVLRRAVVLHACSAGKSRGQVRKARKSGWRSGEKIAAQAETVTHQYHSVGSIFRCQLNVFDATNTLDDDRDTGRTSSDPSDVVPAQVCVDVRRWRRNVSHAERPDTVKHSDAKCKILTIGDVRDASVLDRIPIRRACRFPLLQQARSAMRNRVGLREEDIPQRWDAHSSDCAP